MDKRFSNMFGLTEDQAIALLETPIEQLAAPTEHYVAVSTLINFPTERSINALIDVLNKSSAELYDRITRRKAIESLGRLQATRALSNVHNCLDDEDRYTVENAAWAIGEIGTTATDILEDISGLLERPDQSYRTIIQTLEKLNYVPAVEKIQKFIDHEDKTIASAAIATICRLTRNYDSIGKVLEFLEDSSVTVRRSAIQDLITAKYYQAIPTIARCPVSLVFRLRAIRLLANDGFTAEDLTFADIESDLDAVILDHPKTLELVHEYDQKPTLEFAVRELYHTDFGRCYLAIKTLEESYPEATPAALFDTWKEEAHNDYGAHYHVIKLFGWLKHQPAFDLCVEALNNRAPQFQKSRAAAAIALSEIGDQRAIPLLKESLQTGIFDLQYGSLLGLKKLGETIQLDWLPENTDPLIRAKAEAIA